MRHFLMLSLALSLLCLGFLSLSGEARAQAKMEKGGMKQTESLYKRLGGYDAIAAVTDEFVGRLVNNKTLARFFTGASTNSKNRIRQLVVDQLCAVTGGPCVYIGRDMKTAHAGMGITEADWNAAVKDLLDTLDKFKVPQKEKDELVAIVASTKPDIVEKP
jgi:hemoglobin